MVPDIYKAVSATGRIKFSEFTAKDPTLLSHHPHTLVCPATMTRAKVSKKLRRKVRNKTCFAYIQATSELWVLVPVVVYKGVQVLRVFRTCFTL